MTLDEYERMAERAEGRCEICTTKLDALDGLNGLVIDHTDDRPFGQRGRGLLCNSCNLGIGLLKHSPERLMAAAEYVSKF